MPTGPQLVSTATLAARPELARELTLRRVGLGISQAELARRVGLHRTTITFYETGAMTPSAPTLARVKKALGWPE